MWRGGVCQILFRKPGFDLDDAFQALSVENGVSVTRIVAADGADALAVQHHDGPRMTIGFVTGPTVQRQAVGIGRGTPHVEALGQCDAYFWISMDNVHAASAKSA